MTDTEAIKARAKVCPNCGSADTRKEIALRPKPSVLMVLLMSWYYLLVRGAFGRCAAYCQSCQHRFRYKSIGSWIALVVVVLIIALIAAAIYSENRMYD